MFSIFTLLLSIFIPLEYYPYFDTYETFCERSQAHSESSPYIPQAVEGELLSEGLSEAYTTILDHLNQDFHKAKKELGALGLSDKMRASSSPHYVNLKYLGNIFTLFERG